MSPTELRYSILEHAINSRTTSKQSDAYCSYEFY